MLVYQMRWRGQDSRVHQDGESPRETFSFERVIRGPLKTSERFHWEIKGRFPKRVVLANVPSFRFSFRGNIRRNHPFGNHPFVNTKKGHWEIKGRFPKGWFWRMYPRSGFRSGGTSAETTLLETTLLRTPEGTLVMKTKSRKVLLGGFQRSSRRSEGLSIRVS